MKKELVNLSYDYKISFVSLRGSWACLLSTTLDVVVDKLAKLIHQIFEVIIVNEEGLVHIKTILGSDLISIIICT